MENDTVKNSDEHSVMPVISGISEPSNDVIYIDKKRSGRMKGKSDDIMLTQCILCLILALSVFLLKYINEDFQTGFISLYKQRTEASAEPFIMKITEIIEAWFKR
ncbi:MAG: hypothetical protein ACI4JD_03090 [Ruminococcus sp.]